jgi:hypothetical protein
MLLNVIGRCVLEGRYGEGDGEEEALSKFGEDHYLGDGMFDLFLK